jgi:hypothetical protein
VAWALQLGSSSEGWPQKHVTHTCRFTLNRADQACDASAPAPRPTSQSGLRCPRRPSTARGLAPPPHHAPELSSSRSPCLRRTAPPSRHGALPPASGGSQSGAPSAPDVLPSPSPLPAGRLAHPITGDGTPAGNAKQCKAMQGNARQGKARQGKARQGKAMQGKARQGDARQGNARQCKAMQGSARQCASLQPRPLPMITRAGHGQPGWQVPPNGQETVVHHPPPPPPGGRCGGALDATPPQNACDGWVTVSGPPSIFRMHRFVSERKNHVPQTLSPTCSHLAQQAPWSMVTPFQASGPDATSSASLPRSGLAHDDAGNGGGAGGGGPVR